MCVTILHTCRIQERHLWSGKLNVIKINSSLQMIEISVWSHYYVALTEHTLQHVIDSVAHSFVAIQSGKWVKKKKNNNQKRCTYFRVLHLAHTASFQGWSQISPNENVALFRAVLEDTSVQFAVSCLLHWWPHEQILWFQTEFYLLISFQRHSSLSWLLPTSSYCAHEPCCNQSR